MKGEKRELVTGFFAPQNSKTNSVFWLGENKITREEVPKEAIAEIVKSPKYPMWLLRHSIGTGEWQEEYADWTREEYLNGTHDTKIKKYFRNGNLKSLNYNGMHVPVSESGYSHPVGPIHAGVIEPGHFRFSLEGEHIQSLDIRLGFQTRDIRKKIIGLSALPATHMIESISGDSSVAYSTAASRIYEMASGFSESVDMKLWRAVLLEVERVAIHIGDIGAIGADIGYYPIHGVCSTERGVPLGIMERLVGNRFGRFANLPGKVVISEKCNPQVILEILNLLKNLKKTMEFHFSKMRKNPTIKERLENCGMITKQQAYRNAYVGMVWRCTGLKGDLRFQEDVYKSTPKPMNLELEELKGDAWSRLLLRYQEVVHSIDWLLEALPLLNLNLKTLKIQEIAELKTKPGIYFQAVEGWRGPVLISLVLDDKSRVVEGYFRDPSVLNWHSLELAVRKELIGDFPLNNKSFNLSYVGVDL